MIKKIISLLLLLSFASCSQSREIEAKKTSRSNDASSRINSIDKNNKEIFKELDE